MSPSLACVPAAAAAAQCCQPLLPARVQGPGGHGRHPHHAAAEMTGAHTRGPTLRAGMAAAPVRHSRANGRAGMAWSGVHAACRSTGAMTVGSTYTHASQPYPVTHRTRQSLVQFYSAQQRRGRACSAVCSHMLAQTRCGTTSQPIQRLSKSCMRRGEAVSFQR